jgi:hypothetical protein
MYSNKGTNPMLKRVENFKHKEYAARFEVDVSKYEDNNLGKNLSTGSQPKPWLSDLVTRLNATADGYVTAAQISSTPALTKNQRVDIPVWISTDGTEGNAKLCSGKFRFDVKHGLIDFEARVEIMTEKGKTREMISVTDWSAVGIWITVATVLENQQVVESTGETYLPETMYELILKPDLVPERRQNTWLPDLSTELPHQITKLSTSAEEKYIDIEDRLTEAATSAQAQSPKVETPITLLLEFFPVWAVGDRISVAGRSTGATGDEVITSISFDVTHSYETRIQASNVMKSVDPEKFVHKRNS